MFIFLLYSIPFVLIYVIYKSGDPTSQSTAIKWKKNQNLIEKFHKRSQAANKGDKNNRKRAPEVRSFFIWFTDGDFPSGDEIAEVLFIFFINVFNVI